jgi:large subunit ribosomal protein L5
MSSQSLKEKYYKVVIPAIRKELKLSNDLAVPAIVKVVVNTGFSDLKDKDLKEQTEKDFWTITGQKPVFKKARKSIAGFKIREGQEIGMAVTLRGSKMWDFIERFVGVTLPRVRDFRGISEKSFDSQGNLTIGVRESIVFPEIDPEKSPKSFSLEATIVMNKTDRLMNIGVLKALGFPIKEEDEDA